MGIKMDVNETDISLTASYLVNRFTVNSTALLEMKAKQNVLYNTQESLYLDLRAADVFM